MSNQNTYVDGTPDWIKPYLDEVSAKWQVPTLLLSAQISQESSFNPQAASPAGAQGIAQFMPSTAKAYGVDPWDLKSSLEGQAHMMADLYGRYGSWDQALSAYNSGNPNAYKDPTFANGETYNYVQSIGNKISGGQQSIAGAAYKNENGQAVSTLNQNTPPTTNATPSTSGQPYTVKKGDTLWGLAQQYLGSGAKWRQIGGYSGSPNTMPVGTNLVIPAQPPPPATYNSAPQSTNIPFTPSGQIAATPNPTPKAQSSSFIPGQNGGMA